jgi:hypothetical protein
MVFSAVAGVEISLSGTVKDGNGAAISGATVMLVSDSLMKDTTSASGEFTIKNATAIRRGGAFGISVKNTNNIGIKGNQLQFSSTSPINSGVVSIFSRNGKKVVAISLGSMESGVHMYKLPELSAGFYVMNIMIDKSTTSCKLINTGNEVFMSDNYSGVNSNSRISLNGAVESVDTLIVKKDGYEVVKKTISSYTETGIAIVMGTQPMYAYGATVENTCADCVVPELTDASKLTVKNSKLPDPFKKIDGTRITKKSEWRCRRQEILKQAMKYIYGDKPAPPEVVSGTVTETKITVHVEDKGKKIDFSATVKLPTTGKAPYPAIINMGTGASSVTQKVSSQGVAIIYYKYSEIAGAYADASAGIRDKPPQGLFFDIYGVNHSARQLMAWAWGASRIIDVLQKSGGAIIDYRRLAVTGCSRDAKGAFAIGLFDERMALTLPEETSLGGIPAYRIADAKCAENTQNNFTGQTWLSNDFKPFVSNTSLLPIDAHELVAAMAPRGLFSMENPAAAQMCAPGGNMAIQGGLEVYKALGAEKNLSYNSKTPSGTGHCSYTDNFTDPLIKNVTRFLKHETAETGKIEPGATLPRADWIDWTAPTLENDTKIYETQ